MRFSNHQGSMEVGSGEPPQSIKFEEGLLLEFEGRERIFGILREKGGPTAF